MFLHQKHRHYQDQCHVHLSHPYAQVPRLPFSSLRFSQPVFFDTSAFLAKIFGSNEVEMLALPFSFYGQESYFGSLFG
jgi:hypothetical protein